MSAGGKRARAAPRRALRRLLLRAGVPATPLTLYALGLALLAAGFLLATPILALDTDLWYHLAYGRQMVDSGRLPTASDFSFLAPPRPLLDYYWLFQLVVYALFRLGGYGALIVARSALFALLAAALLVLIFGRRGYGHPGYGHPGSGHPGSGHPGSGRPGYGHPGPPRDRRWALFVFILYALVLSDRFMLVRPHMLSFLFLALALLILEAAPRWLPALPVVGVLWANLHGVEYPLLLVVVGAYLGEDLLARWRQRTALDRRRTVLLALTAASVLATPHGVRLLAVPFTPTTFASSFIYELRRLAPADYLAFKLSPAALSAGDLMLVLVLVVLAAALAAAWRRDLRPAHLALLAGGLLLLGRAARLQAEFVLLGLPLLVRALPPEPPPAARRGRALPALLGLALLILPLRFVAGRYGVDEHGYPLSPRNLPRGVAGCLRAFDLGGRVLHEPGVGGYLQWALVPRYRIFANMEVPFLFSAQDWALAKAALRDRGALAWTVEAYAPDFIVTPLANDAFPALRASQPQYLPVCFDDWAALYVDGDRHPALASSHGLAGVDPFALSADRLAALDGAARGAAIERLEAMIALGPPGDLPRRVLATLEALAGRPEAALGHARAAVSAAPWAWRARQLEGGLLRQLGRDPEALDALRGALARAPAAARGAIQRELAGLYAALERPCDAYRAWRRAVGAFNPQASFQDLYRLGVLAAACGRPDEARAMLQLAAPKVPAAAAGWRQRIDRARERLDAAPSDD